MSGISATSRARPRPVGVFPDRSITSPRGGSPSLSPRERQQGDTNSLLSSLENLSTGTQRHTTDGYLPHHPSQPRRVMTMGQDNPGIGLRVEYGGILFHFLLHLFLLLLMMRF